MLDIESIISAAQTHGRDSEPDHEAGDLQDALRTAVSLMSETELKALYVGDVMETIADTADVELPATRPAGTAFAQLLLDMAERHGSFDDPDHEIGDLQDLLREAWRIMPQAQRRSLMANDAVVENLDEWGYESAPNPA